MHFTPKPQLALLAVALTVVPGIKTVAKAQNFAGLPSCAEPAIFAAIQGSGCDLTDAKCLCGNPELFPTILTSIQQACSPKDLAAVEAFGATYCGALTIGNSATTSESASAASSPTSATTATMTKTTELALPGFTLTSSSLDPMTTDSSASASTSYHRSMTYSTTATATSTSATKTGGAAGVLETGASAAGLALAVAGLGWVFAEL
ncbi:hypothetical protein LTR37_020135 [Vermiconidia calcicola]|uniref:Uncharacterized protein n=1 Tax=Vermiconidia calcicola TaxID=1690605 RepID=A0ACC3MC41_9PEZI|nr:hypothetical protein LTR37_020135 [Vermiconidia calcicola]